ncbi:MAG TPA: ABC transporter permease [Candidatus Thalassarchaeaceae archaeon]|nr:ABC transporter permease [Candidatus Thalassarchaeaceae archaeon]DAC52345.1 MAG TPA: ABC transporter permease [Candidatus Poseidoniales archaeon]HIH82358.1 ABC transporter permease [Candidatus Thalassarchaeaceae archaeon]
MNAGRVYAIAARKFTSLRRDKRMFGFIIIMPAIQILLFGIAIGQAPTGLDFAIVDDGADDIGAIVVGHLDGSESLVIDTEYKDMSSARLDIEEGELWGALHIHPNGTFEILLDNSNQQVSNTIIVEVRNAMTAAMASQGVTIPMEIAEPVYGDKDPAFIDFLAPGIMTMVCFMFSLILTSMAFVGERYDGTLDRIFAAGTRPSEVLLGHMGAFSSILVGQVLVVILIATFGFNITIEGSILLLFILGLLLGWAAMCYGLFVSSKAKSEFQAMQLNMPVLFPVLLLSGILWPVQALPSWIQPLSWALPTTWTAEAFRSIMIRGWGLDNFGVQFAFAFNILFALFALFIASRSLKVRE